MHPQLSIIIPVYNAQSTLAACVKSLAHGGETAFEVILVDDGSYDGSRSVCERLARQYGFVRCILGKHEGAAAARNAGLREALGEWVTFVDADDMVQPGALDIIAEHFKPGIQLLTWDYVTTDGRQCDVGSTGPTAVWQTALRRSFIATNELAFVHGTEYGEDLEFLDKALACRPHSEHIPQSLYVYNAANRYCDGQRRVADLLGVAERMEGFISGRGDDYITPESFGRLYRRIIDVAVAYRPTRRHFDTPERRTIDSRLSQLATRAIALQPYGTRKPMLTLLSRHIALALFVLGFKCLSRKR